MVFVMILIRINSVETCAACAAGVICFFVHYFSNFHKLSDSIRKFTETAQFFRRHECSTNRDIPTWYNTNL